LTELGAGAFVLGAFDGGAPPLGPLLLLLLSPFLFPPLRLPFGKGIVDVSRPTSGLESERGIKADTRSSKEGIPLSGQPAMSAKETLCSKLEAKS
jgi:hypothetical protein